MSYARVRESLVAPAMLICLTLSRCLTKSERSKGNISLGSLPGTLINPWTLANWVMLDALFKGPPSTPVVLCGTQNI